MIAVRPRWTVSQSLPLQNQYGSTAVLRSKFLCKVFGEMLQTTSNFGINLINLFFQNPKEEVEEVVVLEAEEAEEEEEVLAGGQQRV